MLEIKAADELVDPELEARWALRRAGPATHVLRRVLRSFVEHSGPILVDAIAAGLADLPVEALRESLAKLDQDDLIRLEDGRVEIAYPFSATPTAFVVRLAAGHERFACCATDALGIAPMLGQRIDVRSQCHHCGSPVEFSVTPDGPAPEARGMMVWVGKRCEGDRRLAASL
jgi:Alkylmercury lyase